MRIANWVLVSSVAFLTACGGGGSSGGGDSPATTGFDSTEFQGTWARNDGTADTSIANCFNFTTYGGTFGGLNRPSVITATTLTSKVDVYSDNTCGTKVGLLTQTYSISWAAGSVAGKTNVAKVILTSTGYTNSADGAGGYVLPTPPVIGVVSKTLLYVVGTLMYLGNTAPVDADSFPTTLAAAALYTR